MHVAEAKQQRVDLGSANRRAIQLGIGVDVEPADVQPDRSGVADLVVDAGLHREAKAVIKIERAKRGLFVEEVGIVDARADIGFPRAIVGEVVVQRKGRRQVLGAGLAHAIDCDVVLKGSRGQKFDAEVVADEILDGEDQAFVAGDRNIAARKRAVVRAGINRRDANTKGPVAMGLREGGASGQSNSSGQTCGSENVFHGLNTFVHSDDVLMRPIRSGRFDLGQIFRRDAAFSNECGAL